MTNKNRKPEDKLKAIFLKIFPNLKNDEFDLRSSRNSFENWDSLVHLQLVSEIESAFGMSFDIDEIIAIEKPADFIQLINKKNG